VWLFEDELTPTQVRKSRSIKKNDLHIFYNQRYFDANHFGKSATAQYYVNAYLNQMMAKLKNLRPRSRMNI